MTHFVRTGQILSACQNLMCGVLNIDMFSVDALHNEVIIKIIIYFILYSATSNYELFVAL